MFFGFVRNYRGKKRKKKINKNNKMLKKSILLFTVRVFFLNSFSQTKLKKKFVTKMQSLNRCKKHRSQILCN